MRVLWLCNVMLPVFAKAHGLPYTNREGWLSGCYERMTEEWEQHAENGEPSEIELLLVILVAI